jgi:hypothetical protein
MSFTVTMEQMFTDVTTQVGETSVYLLSKRKRKSTKKSTLFDILS